MMVIGRHELGYFTRVDGDFLEKHLATLAAAAAEWLSHIRYGDWCDVKTRGNRLQCRGSDEAGIYFLL